MITNEWIQGHLAAIKDCIVAIDAMIAHTNELRENKIITSKEHYSRSEPQIEFKSFLVQKKEDLKILVDKLNEKNA